MGRGFRKMITCDCSVYDSESPELYFDKVVKARKEHKCCECREPIKKGDSYEYVKTLYDGYWDTYKTCIPCTRIRRDYCPRGWIFEWIFEFLEETIDECLGFRYTEDPADWDDDDDEPPRKT
jgi:hypothetical protein